MWEVIVYVPSKVVILMGGFPLWTHLIVATLSKMPMLGVPTPFGSIG
jgi:hypothetical protein